MFVAIKDIHLYLSQTFHFIYTSFMLGNTVLCKFCIPFHNLCTDGDILAIFSPLFFCVNKCAQNKVLFQDFYNSTNYFHVVQVLKKNIFILCTFIWIMVKKKHKHCIKCSKSKQYIFIAHNMK